VLSVLFNVALAVTNRKKTSVLPILRHRNLSNDFEEDQFNIYIIRIGPRQYSNDTGVSAGLDQG
jgi:hypothetical protein